MKKAIILTIIFSIFLIGGVSASGFSPSSLTFNLVPNQEQCQTITITSTSGSITVSDIWAKNKDIEWKFDLFTDSASSHSLSLNYPSSLSLNERTINVCLSGSNIGEYHGIMLIKEAQEGNSIIQMGIWLKVIISAQGSNSNSQTSATTSQTTTSNQVQAQPVTQQTNTTNNATQQSADNSENEDVEEQNSLITGGAIGLMSQHPVTFVIVFVLILAILATIVFRNKIRSYIQWQRYGY